MVTRKKPQYQPMRFSLRDVSTVSLMKPTTNTPKRSVRSIDVRDTVPLPPDCLGKPLDGELDGLEDEVERDEERDDFPEADAAGGGQTAEQLDDKVDDDRRDVAGDDQPPGGEVVVPNAVDAHGAAHDVVDAGPDAGEEDHNKEERGEVVGDREQEVNCCLEATHVREAVVGELGEDSGGEALLEVLVVAEFENAEVVQGAAGVRWRS